MCQDQLSSIATHQIMLRRKRQSTLRAGLCPLLLRKVARRTRILSRREGQFRWRPEYGSLARGESPIFEGKFRLTSKVKISANPDFAKSLGTNRKTTTIAGQLHCQACDETICYVPVSIPVTWQLQIPVSRPTTLAGSDSAQIGTE